MTIDFVSILLFLGIGQCLFLIIAIAANRKKAYLSNDLLIGILTAFLWYQLEFFLLRHKLDTQIPFVYSTRYGSWLIIGPLILLYNRTTLIKGYRLKLKDFGHFIPFFLFTIILPLSFQGLITNRAVDYGILTVFDSWNQETITFRHYLYGFIFIAQYLHAMAYVLISYKEMRAMIATNQLSRSNGMTFKIQSLQYLYLIGFLIIILCSGFVIFQFFTQMWRRTFDYLYVLPMLIFVFGLAYRAMKYPDSALILGKKEGPKYSRSGLTDQLAANISSQLKKLLEEDKIYHNPDLRLKILADSLGISTHHLSQVINTNFQKNFFDLVNSYRIREAKEIIANGSEQTLLEIAYQVGFNSKNSFNNSFKKHTGMTPTAFKKQEK